MKQLIADIMAELTRAEAKFPDWPADPVHAAAIVAEESGELTQASLDFYYHREEARDKMRTEALHTAAMALRFLKGLDGRLFKVKIVEEHP